MALSGTRLQTALASDIYAQLQAIFPLNADLLAAEKTLILAAQQNLANAMANAAGPDIVSEITGNAVVPIGIVGTVTSGPGAGGGTSTTATGTVA